MLREPFEIAPARFIFDGLEVAARGMVFGRGLDAYRHH